MSNYEYDSVFEWFEYLFSVRKAIITLFQKSETCICKQLEEKALGNLASEMIDIITDMNRKLIREFRYPNEGLLFEGKVKISEETDKVINKYFTSILNFCNQFVGFLCRDIDKMRLALINLRTAQSSLEIMQDSLENISNEQGIFQQQHSELSVLEEQGLQCLLIACLYFNEHQPSKYFSKYQMRNWYNENNKNAMKKAKETLCGLSTEYHVIFPVKYYYDYEILTFYPIIVHNLNMTDSVLLMEFFCNCIPFVELDYNYLMVVNTNDQGKVRSDGLKIPKDFLIKLRTAINNDDATLAEKLPPPFPDKVTAKILDCFEYKYEILTPAVTRYEGVDRIAELLWAFSKSRNELYDDSDTKYRNHVEGYYKKEIKNQLRVFESRIPQTEFNEISQLCNDVFNNYEFDDISFNTFYNNIISKSLE
jgi:hypothetical protein